MARPFMVYCSGNSETLQNEFLAIQNDVVKLNISLQVTVHEMPAKAF